MGNDPGDPKFVSLPKDYFLDRDFETVIVAKPFSSRITCGCFNIYLRDNMSIRATIPRG
jgi:hypothetical protein